MMKTLKIGLIGFVLGAAVAVGTATVGSEETAAIPCCSSCDGTYNSCISNCGSDVTCQTNCETKYDKCSALCSSSC
jgi:hypothetical protein